MSTKLAFIIALLSFIIVIFKVSFFMTPPVPVTSTVSTPDSKCIITIDSTKYDVTIFKNQHSGGDIFNCGTDMSSIFHSQHGQRFMKQMQKYKL